MECLDNSGSQSTDATTSRYFQDRRPSSASLSSRLFPGIPTTSTNAASALAERNTLFNFGRKRSTRASTSGKSKKKRLVTWNHDFVCVARTDQEKTPTALERSKLISAGM